MSNETLGGTLPESGRPQTAQAPEGSGRDSGSAWMPFALTVESALNRGDDPALLFDENSPIRGELRRLIALHRAALGAKP